MTINRYSPNPRLIAPSTEQRMVLAADGDYTDAETAHAMKKALEDIKRHIEFIMPDDYKKSAIWHMAVKGLSST